MNISLELPPGVPLPTLKGTLVGEINDLHIQIRFKDLLDTLKAAVDGGAGIKVDGGLKPEHNFEVPPKAPAAPKPAAKKAAAKKLAPPPVAETSEAPVANGAYIPVPGTAPHSILAALAKKPLSPIELAAELGSNVTLANIYTTTANLKGRGLIDPTAAFFGRGTDEADAARDVVLLE